MITLQKIREFSGKMGQQAAVVNGDKCLSWDTLARETEQKIRYLLGRYGTQLPRHACYITENRMDLIPWLAAFATLSIPVTGIDYTLPLETIQFVAHDIKADFTLISSRSLGLQGGMPTLDGGHGIVFDLDSPTMNVIDAIGDQPTPDLLGRIAALQAPPFRAVGLTSGTSGRPKSVVRVKSFEQRRFAYFTARYRFCAEDRFMVAMPLYHAAGNGWARLFMSLGATLYLGDMNRPAEMAKLAHEAKITASVMNPRMLSSFIAALKEGGLNCPPALRWLLVGGRNFSSVEKRAALAALGHVVYEYYGTTESGVNTIAEPDDLLHFPDSVGRPYEGNYVAILSPSGVELPLGAIGNVAIASYMNMTCYGDGSAPFVKLADGENYFLTPDQGYMDPTGRLYLLNRAGGNGEGRNLYGLEDAIRGLPCVRDVAVTLHEGLIQCIFSTRPGSALASRVVRKIHELAEAAHVALAQVRCVGEIPYSPSGKVRVKDMEALLCAA